MRKIILGCGISLDGYIARLTGDVDFLFMPKDYSQKEFFSSIDTYIMGRKTLDAARKMGGSFGGSKAPAYVFSRSQPVGKREGVTFVNQPPADFVAQLREKDGKDVWHMGGGELARAFFEADLIDEIRLGIVPTLLGEGIPLFPAGFPQREFELTECKRYSGGLASLEYRRIRGAKSKANKNVSRRGRR